MRPDSPQQQRLIRKQTMRNLVLHLGVDVCTLYHFDEARRELALVASHGLGEGAVGYRMPIDVGLTGRVARTRRPVSAKHPAQHPDFHYVEGSGEERFHSFLGIPLLRFSDLLGVVVVQTVEPKVFLMRDIEELYRVGKALIGEHFPEEAEFRHAVG